MIPEPTRTRLAVLGSPIAHSRSPRIHAAAYRALGLPWDYGLVEVQEGGLAAFVDGLDDRWRGLSLTMPLKREALAVADTASEVARATGSVNTIVFSDAGIAGHNTDVDGVVGALRGAGIGRIESAHVLGAGATAASVVAAVGILGAGAVDVAARRREQIAGLAAIGAAFGVAVRAADWEPSPATELVVNTVPGGPARAFDPALRAAVPLLEVAYDPWPTPLAEEWLASHGTVVSGLEILLHQAVGQVRLFASGGAAVPLPGEDEAVAAMRAALA